MSNKRIIKRLYKVPNKKSCVDKMNKIQFFIYSPYTIGSFHGSLYVGTINSFALALLNFLFSSSQ